MARIRAPELPQHYAWLNTDRPLSLTDLKGRVVILDFWTYCCINCLHILPDLKYLEQKYRDCLTVIGVHSAKFDNEKETENIRQAILRYDIEHPVLVDSGFQVWQQYAVRAWPTLIVIDPEGYVIGAASGEGKRDRLDELIGKLVQEHRQKGTVNFQALSLKLEKQQHPLTSRLAFPGKVLADAESNLLFIADSGHHRLVVTSLSGDLKHGIGTGEAGLRDGRFDEAQFFAPQGIAFDRSQQILYVADTENHAIRQINLKQQTIETIAGTGKQSRVMRPHNGQALELALNSPWDLVKIDHFLFIAMAGSHQIWALDLNDGLIGTYAGTGAEACVDGSLDEATFAQPSGLATDGEELFVADSEGSTIRAVGLGENAQVRSICGSGDLFGFGDVDGQGEAVRLQHCLGVAYAGNHQLWIADTYNHKIKRVNTDSGDCQTILGDGLSGWLDGRGQTTRFAEPSGLSLAGEFLYIADTNNHAIRRVNLETLAVTTLSFPDLCAPDLCFPN
ncbi:thioredoxin-like domain-containing protein [Thermocoleostomius sinensis]|uniref:Thioredoxin-like domain-containing protein n=1 Tax=Thermocoleostomius sinensis A174 TaxID=2016057 RepID=A0A9E9C613_9CYAN|nr:thioredoxin-like domain-containing protein [Thermocoleostomius sinensis]WAL58759.1 thioredoxin-like domain-containing protein [Thermocoleostomius sinensis A174]